MPPTVAQLHPDALAAAHAELVATLSDLIRIPSINPPDPPGAELQAARWIAAALEDAGLRPEVVEPFPGRGSVIARLRGDGTGGDPLLLLSHLDVVPAQVDGWTRDPFGGEVADGYVWGRGAVDMKAMVAMEIQVLRLLAASARSAGRDPASDPVPGLTRDVLFACTADEEAGGREGIGWLVEHRPESLRAAGALNEAGAVTTTLQGRRLYPIQVAEKGFAVYRIVLRGTSGHGSMPRPENAAVLAADAIQRLAEPGMPRLTPVMRVFLEQAAREVGGEAAGRLRAIAADPLSAESVLAGCEPTQARALRALLRDTVSPGVVRSGVKYNIIPDSAEVVIDCRTLPGTDEVAMREEVVRRLGPQLAAVAEVELVISADPVEAPIASPLYAILEETVRDHDPGGIPLPVMAPFSTDAKHLAKLGVPSYGFSPLRLDPAERFLDRFHGVDERVAVDALRWGLPVLYDAVRRFCGVGPG